jgi:hypothetical protein
MLKGRPVPWQRNPVGYYDTANLDAMSAAERAGFAQRHPVTMVVTWNPAKWNPDGVWAEQTYPQQVQAVASGGLWRGQWATGGRKGGIEPGDRVFFLRQGVEPRGVIGSGTTVSRIFSEGHWDDDRAGGIANYVLIDWDTLLLPEDGLPHEVVVDRIPEGGTWRPQASGWVLPLAAAAKLEELWAEHLSRATPPLPRSTPRQGWQMDPVRRKKVEDAAQAMLMEHFRKDKWIVHDVRFGNPYDAIATKDGRRLWLEAKGTETSGASVIVTRNEVEKNPPLLVQAATSPQTPAAPPPADGPPTPQQRPKGVVFSKLGLAGTHYEQALDTVDVSGLFGCCVRWLLLDVLQDGRHLPVDRGAVDRGVHRGAGHLPADTRRTGSGVRHGVVGDDVDDRAVVADDDAAPAETGLPLEVFVDVSVRGHEVLWCEAGGGAQGGYFQNLGHEVLLRSDERQLCAAGRGAADVTHHGTPRPAREGHCFLGAGHPGTQRHLAGRDSTSHDSPGRASGRSGHRLTVMVCRSVNSSRPA